MIETTLRVRADAPIGTISPRLYGHFAEHLGRCCYDGLWVGTHNKTIPHYGGFRSDVVDALKAMPVPLLRWPGGCYADHYHWRDGIGAPESRPVRLGLSCGLQVEYCNSAVNTTLARERADNGSPEPFGVRLWGVGNENWGCGGSYDAVSYAREYRRYATMLRHVDPQAELVACGHDDAWNQKFLETNYRHLGLMDHFSIHRYWINGGPELDFTEEQYYGLLAEADDTENFVSRTAGYIRGTQGDSRQKIGIALDEWGVWHPEARPWGLDSHIHREQITYEQAGTLRDALAVGVALEGFHRQCNVLTLANLAQIVNILHAPIMTEGDAMWITPSYYALQLHIPHLNATALPVEVSHGATMPGSDYTSVVTTTASTTAAGTTVSLVNRHYVEGAVVTLNVPSTSHVVSAQLLAADDPRATNSVAQPDRVRLEPLTVSEDGAGQWRVELPAHSMATIQLA